MIGLSLAPTFIVTTIILPTKYYESLSLRLHHRSWTKTWPEAENLTDRHPTRQPRLAIGHLSVAENLSRAHENCIEFFLAIAIDFINLLRIARPQTNAKLCLWRIVCTCPITHRGKSTGNGQTCSVCIGSDNQRNISSFRRDTVSLAKNW